MKNIAIVLCGGSGKRVGAGIPKQFIKIFNKPIVIWTLEKLENMSQIDAIDIVCIKGYEETLKELIAKYNIKKVRNIITGGSNFLMSVINGVKEQTKCDKNDNILIHMAISPLVTEDVVNDCIKVCNENGNAFSAVPSTCCMVKKEKGKTYSDILLDRDEIIGLMTPQCVKYGKLLEMLKFVEKQDLEAVEKHLSTIMLEMGEKLYLSKSLSTNIKITTKEDLELFEALLTVRANNKSSELINFVKNSANERGLKLATPIEEDAGMIIDMICNTIGCSLLDIGDFQILPKGLSNISIVFKALGKRYILRIPSKSASIICDRAKEMIAQKEAYKCGIDSTHLFIDEKGYKLSEYMDGIIDIEPIFYKDIDFMKRVVGTIKKLHSHKISDEQKQKLFFDPIEKGDELLNLNYISEDKYSEMRSLAVIVNDFVEKYGKGMVLSHIDLNISNVITDKVQLDFIDWEFAGFTEACFDFGRILDGYDIGSSEVKILISEYLGRKAVDSDLEYFYAGVVLHSYYFYCWCLYKESVGENVAHYIEYFKTRFSKWIKGIKSL